MGIDIKLHITFLMVLPIFVMIFAVNSAPYGFGDIEPPMQYVLALLCTVLLFTCVLLHELGHSYFAQKYGFKVDNITLFLIGGIASMEDIPRDPAQEAKMAFAGPMVSFMIGSILLALNFVISSLIPTYALTSPYRLVLILGSINIVLGIFNLLPAFPMDGGRILRAWYARKISYVEATHTAANVGKMFAILMALLGLISSPWNPWLLMIAIFVYMGASGEDRTTTVTTTLEKVKVRDVMTSGVVSVLPSLTIEQLTQFMFEHKHMGYPVMEHNVLKGIVTFSDVRKVTSLERFSTLVSDVMTRDVVPITVDAPASDAFKLITSNNIGRLIVMDDDDVVGILSRTDLMHTMTLLSE